jgi:hypothetical protein
LESVTLTDTLKVPSAAGVPFITPTLDTVSPLGKPVVSQVYGPVPPEAARLAEYATPAVPFGSDCVVIVTGMGAITTLKF